MFHSRSTTWFGITSWSEAGWTAGDEYRWWRADHAMINSEESNRRSAENELVVKEQFENLKYLVTRLDHRKSNRQRPDFLISNPSGPQMLCEVKTVDSGGYPRDKRVYGVEHVHISTLDPEFRGKFQNIPINLSKIDEGLASAVRKRKALVEDEPHFADLPLLVAFFFDFFAEYLFSYPRSFNERDESFREVSGILTIERDVARNKAFEQLSREEQERLLRAELERAGLTETTPELDDDLPPHSKNFALVRNKTAIREVPPDFQIQCIVEPYDASL
jgi:hypothetical protein